MDSGALSLISNFLFCLEQNLVVYLQFRFFFQMKTPTCRSIFGFEVIFGHPKHTNNKNSNKHKKFVFVFAGMYL